MKGKLLFTLLKDPPSTYRSGAARQLSREPQAKLHGTRTERAHVIGWQRKRFAGVIRTAKVGHISCVPGTVHWSMYEKKTRFKDIDLISDMNCHMKAVPPPGGEHEPRDMHHVDIPGYFFFFDLPDDFAP